MHSFEQLIREHDAIGVAVVMLEKTLKPAKPNVTAALAARDRLCALVAEHIEHEDSEVYPRLIAANDGPTADIASRFRTEYSAILDDWTAYIDRWSAAAIEADWRAFRRATTAVLDRFQRRIVDENALLFPTALAASEMKLRA